jgi:hypothetical protein
MMRVSVDAAGEASYIRRAMLDMRDTTTGPNSPRNA